MLSAKIDTRALLCTTLALSAFVVLPSSTGAKAVPGAGAPLVVTGSPHHAKGPSGTLQGKVDPRGAVTTYYFQYGPTTAYGLQTPIATLPAGTVDIRVAKSVNGLLAGYHYRLVATNSYGSRSGKDAIYVIPPVRLKLKLNKPTTQTVVGGPLVIDGALTGTGAAKHQIVLQANPYPYHEGFDDVSAPITTNSLGQFAIPVAKLLQSSQFRVLTVDPKPSYSAPLTIQAAVRVTLRVRTSPVRGFVRLYGTISPSQSRAKVAIQLARTGLPPKAPRSLKAEEKAEKSPPKSDVKYTTKFRASVKPGTHSFSRFSLIVKVSEGGHYRALAEVPPGPVGGGYSPNVLLHSAPSGKKQTKRS